MSAQPRKSFWDRLSDPQSVISFLLLFCAVHFLVRAVTTPNFTHDESLEVFLSQVFQWGYQLHHPPLVTWLSWATLAPMGGNRTAFLLLKYALLALGLIAYFGAARFVIRNNFYAALASFALLATFSMGYFALADALPTVLLATMLAAYMWADARVLTHGSLLDHLILGVVSGFGILSGYVFVILPIALGIGAALTPSLRARLKPLPLLLTTIVAAAIVAPYALWSHAQDFSLVSASNPAANSLKDIGDLAIAMASFVLPAAILFPLLYWPACAPLGATLADAEDGAWLKTYEIALIAGAVILLGAALFAGADAFKPNLVHEVMLLLPIYAFLRVKISGATDRTNKIFLAFVGLFVLGVIGARVGLYETQADACKDCSAYWPMTTYADGFRQAGFLRGTIVGATEDLAGNLRLHFPDSRVVTQGYAPGLFGADPGGQCLVAWEGDGAAPRETLDYLAATLHAKLTSTASRGDVTAKLLTSKKKFGTMSYILLPEGACH